MTKETLPLKIDPFRNADHSIHLHGTLPIITLVRLGASLYQKEGDIEATIDLGLDEQQICVLRGRIQANLILQCQRCMEPFNYEIISDLLMGVVKTEEEITTLPESYDPLVVKENFLSIQDLIEDELIVNLPIVPMHNAAQCKVKLPWAAETEGLDQTVDNPFKVVELLRKNNRGNDT